MIAAFLGAVMSKRILDIDCVHLLIVVRVGSKVVLQSMQWKTLVEYVGVGCDDCVQCRVGTKAYVVRVRKWNYEKNMDEEVKFYCRPSRK